MRFDNRAKKVSAVSARVAGVLLCAGLVWMAYTPGAVARVVVPGINAPAIVATPSPPLQIPTSGRMHASRRGSRFELG